MALTVSTGFVVDDAIVVLENIVRRLEMGESPLRAGFTARSRAVGFTVVSISISLVAVFPPILFMGGIVGRLFREFSVGAHHGGAGLHAGFPDHHAHDVRQAAAAF